MTDFASAARTGLIAAFNALSAFAPTYRLMLAARFLSGLATRLMDVSGEAQTLPAALNHSAFNTANALGPW